MRRYGHIASSRSISFAFSPRSYIRFTDYPYHSTLTLTDTEKMVIDLADPGWDHRNVAIVFEAMSVHHDIAIYEVSSHQTTDNNDAVEWKGKVLSQTVDEDLSLVPPFNCSLFVDSAKNTGCPTFKKNVFCVDLCTGLTDYPTCYAKCYGETPNYYSYDADDPIWSIKGRSQL